MNDRDLMLLPGWKQREMVVSKEISSRELVEASLRRIEAVDDQLHAFITVDRDGALAAADVADAEVAPRRNDEVSRALRANSCVACTMAPAMVKAWVRKRRST